MTAAGRMNNAIPDEIRHDIHGVLGPVGLANDLKACTSFG